MKSGLSSLLKEVLQILRDFPKGASIEDIEDRISSKLPRWTLRRRLHLLAEEGTLLKKGYGKGTIYKPIASPSGSGVSEIPLSKDARKILKVMGLPRKPGRPPKYRPRFLDSYRPNKTFYLSENERRRLANLGKNSLSKKERQESLSQFYIDFSHSSSQLEGNSCSLLDTHHVLALGDMGLKKPVEDIQLLLNQKEGISFISEKNPPLTSLTVCNLHGLVARNLFPDSRMTGKIRKKGIDTHGFVYVPLEGKEELQERLETLLSKASKIKDPFERSLFLLVQISYLAPFSALNLAVARLAANIPLFGETLSPMSFWGVSDHLYLQAMAAIFKLNDPALMKDVFLQAYETSSFRYLSKELQEIRPNPFRLRYQQAMTTMVGMIVMGRKSPKIAASLLEQASQAFPDEDRKPFIKAVEEELLALHEGNIACYRISPEAFKGWNSLWSRKK